MGCVPAGWLDETQAGQLVGLLVRFSRLHDGNHAPVDIADPLRRPVPGSVPALAGTGRHLDTTMFFQHLRNARRPWVSPKLDDHPLQRLRAAPADHLRHTRKRPGLWPAGRLPEDLLDER